MRILLAIDGTRYSEAAIQMVLAQAVPGKSEVRVVHVVDILTNQIPGMQVNYPGVEHDRDAELSFAESLVENAAELLRSKGLRVYTTIKWGRVAPKIIEAATEWNADLLVLGSHHRVGLGRFVTGVTKAVIRHAACSVEIARVGSAHRVVAPETAVTVDRRL